MKLSEALLILRPNASWTIQGGSYAGLEWHDKVQTKPTLEEIEACIAKNSYAEKRRMEYPSIGDQLDAMWKGGEAAAAMLAAVTAVKTKYPKPE